MKSEYAISVLGETENGEHASSRTVYAWGETPAEAEENAQAQIETAKLDLESNGYHYTELSISPV